MKRKERKRSELRILSGMDPLSIKIITQFTKEMIVGIIARKWPQGRTKGKKAQHGHEHPHSL